MTKTNGQFAMQIEYLIEQHIKAYEKEKGVINRSPPVYPK